MVQKLFTEHPIRFEGRAGGYTRIERLVNNRYGDNAPMARISYLEEATLGTPEEILARLKLSETPVELEGATGGGAEPGVKVQ